MRGRTVLRRGLPLLVGGLALGVVAGSARADDGLRSLLDGLGPAAPPSGDVSVRAWVERGADEPAELVVRLEPRGAARLAAEPGVTVTPVAGDGVAWEVPALLHEEPGRGYWKTPVEVRLPFAAEDGVRVEALVEYAYCLVELQCLFGEARVAAEVAGGADVGAVWGCRPGTGGRGADPRPGQAAGPAPPTSGRRVEPLPVTEHADRPQLEQIIAGLTEGVVLIEPDRTITYANAAALAMHGVGRLDELGRTVDEYRRNFVVSHHGGGGGGGGGGRAVADAEHPAERVLAGEAFSDVLVGVVHRERPGVDWVHRVRGLVITDRDGRPDVLALVIHDATNWHEAERRFEQAFGANPAPAVILRLADMRYVKLNDGFLEMTGLGCGDVLGRGFDEVDVLAGAERRELALERLRAGKTIPQMEACLRVPVDADKLVVVAGQPIELGAADEPCMLFTFADLEPRRRAENALRQSEERFATCFRLAPIPLAIGTVEGYRFVDVNEAFSEATGHGAADVLGRGAAELGLWADEAARERFEAELTRTGGVSGLEARLRPRDGAELDCLVSAEIVAIGDRPCFLWAFQDITDRKRSEGELVAAIEAVMADASWFSRGVVEKLALVRRPPRPGQDPPARLDDLTAREREILALICRGLGDAEIGRDLGLSPNTVRNHVAAVYRKLGVNRRSAAVVWGCERGIGADVPIRRQSSRKRPVRMVESD